MKILFVCTGNTCRSPYAEFLLKYKLKKLNRADIEVNSCGLNVLPNENVNVKTKLILEEKGIKNVDHITTILTEEMVEEADVIYTMTTSQQTIVNIMYKTNKAQLLAELIGEQNILDPYGHGMDTYKKVAEQIDKALDVLIKKL